MRRVKVFTKAAYVNMRALPMVNSAIVDRIRNRGRVIYDHTRNGWHYVMYADRWGYISADVVRLYDDHVPSVSEQTDTSGNGITDRFQSPVMPLDDKLWPTGWRDASPYGVRYFVGTPHAAYHTGADLNFGWRGDDDRGLPVYAPAQGTVIYAATAPVWGTLCIIRHDPYRSADGPVYYTRYGHMQIECHVGQRVARGARIGAIDGIGGYTPHLHYDVVRTNILEARPGRWPKLNKAELTRHYLDPLKFHMEHK